MSSSTTQNWGPPDPKYLVIIDEKTGEEVGRCGGFEWVSIADENGLPVLDARYFYDHQTKDGRLKGPIKKIGFAQEWTGTMSEAQEQEIKAANSKLALAREELRNVQHDLHTTVAYLKALVVMMGGAVSISDAELTLAAAKYAMDEERNGDENGTVLSLEEIV